MEITFGSNTLITTPLAVSVEYRRLLSAIPPADRYAKNTSGVCDICRCESNALSTHYTEPRHLYLCPICENARAYHWSSSATERLTEQAVDHKKVIKQYPDALATARKRDMQTYIWLLLCGKSRKCSGYFQCMYCLLQAQITRYMYVSDGICGLCQCCFDKVAVECDKIITLYLYAAEIMSRHRDVNSYLRGVAMREFAGISLAEINNINAGHLKL